MSPLAENLNEESCKPCHGGSALGPEQIGPYLEKTKGWQLIENHHIKKKYSFKDFKSALAFVDEIGSLAEEQGHHPDIYLTWGSVEVTLFTHKIGGLHENDFILAAKIDKIYSAWVMI